MSSSMQKNTKIRGEETKLYQLKQKTKKKNDLEAKNMNKTNKSREWVKNLSKTAEDVVQGKTGDLLAMFSAAGLGLTSPRSKESDKEVSFK